LEFGICDLGFVIPPSLKLILALKLQHRRMAGKLGFVFWDPAFAEATAGKLGFLNFYF